MGKSYEGERGPGGLLVYVVEDRQSGGTMVRALPPRIDLVAYTPTGTFECGFKGLGPSQLALAVLAEHLGSDGQALELHLGFRDRALVDLPRDRGWCLTGGYIDAHLRALTPSSAQKEKPTLRDHA
jgi:Family of unknown function (DUF6166)